MLFTRELVQRCTSAVSAGGPGEDRGLLLWGVQDMQGQRNFAGAGDRVRGIEKGGGDGGRVPDRAVGSFSGYPLFFRDPEKECPAGCT